MGHETSSRPSCMYLSIISSVLAAAAEFLPLVQHVDALLFAQPLSFISSFHDNA